LANPNKPQPIIDILSNNRDKLLKYLEDFHTDRGEAVGWLVGCLLA
jgi:calcium binding protein 39